MEEIDSIIIESLKNLECELSEDVQSLKQFDSDLVVTAISTCLETILPNNNFPKKLPPSMSLRLKIASNLAEQIKELGFRGDMGYQTILYCNEVEVRRVLMFLIERLPRDTSKSIQIEDSGYVPRLVKKIEDSIKISLEQIWVPTAVLHKGIRPCEDGYSVNSFGESCPLQTQYLEIPQTKENSDDDLKQYWIHTVPDVTRQCSPRQLIPSLLFNDIEFNSQKTQIIDVLRQTAENLISNNLSSDDMTVLDQATATTDIRSQNEDDLSKTNKIKELLNEIEIEKTRLFAIDESLKKNELLLAQTTSLKNEEQAVLKETLSKLKLKTKTQKLIHQEENLLKLKYLVENSNDRLITLANQWNDVQTPLLNEYVSLQNTLSAEELKCQQEQVKFHNVKQTYKILVNDFKEKEILEQQLIKKCQQINKNNNRSSYTRRILEIIGNIKKQNNEIQKVLNDTKAVQKDINNLTGQVDRSFTLSDELIFQNAKQDETARKAYKLLAALRNECTELLKAVTDLGLAERESRNLQEQVESEKSKEITSKLSRVYSDLEEIKKETEILMKQT